MCLLTNLSELPADILKLWNSMCCWLGASLCKSQCSSDWAALHQAGSEHHLCCMLGNLQQHAELHTIEACRACITTATELLRNMAA